MTKENHRPDIYSRITNQIIASLEAGIKPWTQPWAAGHVAGSVSRPLRHNGERYSGINVLTLWATATERGYSAPLWMTFKQALALGGCVRKGEKGAPVVYASAINRTETDERTGEDVERNIPFLKSYTVFNIDQIDGLPAHYYAQASATPNPDERIAEADAFFEATGAMVRHGGTQALYMPGPDIIQLPDYEAFRSVQDYYATRGHETVHWTRHATRLNRDLGRQNWGDAGYAREELVAELGAAFLCADLGLILRDRDDHAAYIASWLKVLRDDKRAIFSAAAHAQRACDYLHSLQPASREAA